MLTKSESRLLHALKTRSGRDKHEAFVVEGIRVVEEAMNAGVDLKFAVVSPTLADSRRGAALAERLEQHTTVRAASESELRDIADAETPQGVIAVASIPHVELARLRIAGRGIVLILDAIQDPGNLGTLVRSADAFGVAGVIALPGTVDYWNPKVVRAAAGASFHVPLVSASESQTWEWLTRHSFVICGADMSGNDAGLATPGERIALVVGNEGSGLRKETRSRVAHMLAIPMPGRAESLNVAVAAGILLYEMSRKNR